MLGRACALAAVLAAASAPAASAAWFGGEAVDSGVRQVGGIDLAADGTGAVVYVKSGDGGSGVFVSRLRDGAFGAPERVDAGEPGPASDPVVAAASGGRLVVAWRAGGRVLGSVSDGGPLRAPTVIGVAAGEPGPPDVDMAIQGTALVTFAMDGDVFAVRWRAGRWDAVPQALDVQPAQPAGSGAGRPRVAVAADGNGVVTWGEDHPDGRLRVYARRVTDLRVSSLPQEVSVPALDGAAAGGADSPDVDIEHDVSFAWVVWRQEFAGASRTLARRLVGSLFEAPAVVDPGPGARAPRIAMNGDGAGLAVSQADVGTVGMAPLRLDAFGSWSRVGEGVAPLAAAAEGGDVAVAWSAGGTVRGRRGQRGKDLGAEASLGAGGAPAELAADEAGNFAVAFLAGDRAAVSVWDRRPRPARLLTSRAFKAVPRPVLRWQPDEEPWGPLTHRVVLDGRPLATTTEQSFTPPADLADGVHKWHVRTSDRRGQSSRSKPRLVRVDTRAPRVSAAIRRAGRVVTVLVRARDRAAGVGSVRVDWGDGTTSAALSHRYPGPGTYSLTLRVADRAGNAVRRTASVRVR